MFGDTNQCNPVEKPSKIHYDYFKSVTIKQMYPKRIEMKYINGEKSRYDIPTKNMLTEFLNTGTVSHTFQPKNHRTIIFAILMIQEEESQKQLYTALSRTIKLEYIQLRNKKLRNKYQNPPFYNMETINSYFNDDDNKGQIYKITFKHNDKLYIGSSMRNLQERLNEHVATKSSPVFKYKDDEPIMTPIIRAPCEDRQELNRVEIEYIRYYSEKYGDRLLNKVP